MLAAMRSSLTLFVAALLLPTLAEGADIYVPADSPTVAGALAFATEGDRVYVAPGLYTERVFVPPGVALLGAGPELSILDGEESGTVVTVLGDGTVVSGFSIRNGGAGSASYGVQVLDADAWVCGNFLYWNYRGVWVEGPSETFVQWNVSADNHDDGLDGVLVKCLGVAIHERSALTPATKHLT